LPSTESTLSTPSTDSTASPRLWGLGTARTLRPIWLFLELGVEFDLKPILTRSAGMDAPEFRALTERSKIPLLEDGDLVIGESAAIVLYLADRYRQYSVFAPEPGTTERARHDELCWFTMTEIDAILYTIRRHEGLPEIYGASAEAVAAARQYFLRSASEMERRLSDGRPYLLGEEFSVSDLILKTCLDWAVILCRIELPTALRSYSDSVSARPAYTQAMKMNFPPEALAALGVGGPS